MTKLVKQLNVAIDLQALTDKKITETTTNLLNHGAWKGALGSATVLSDIFDLYLLVPKCKIPDEEILRWLKAAQLNMVFRKFFIVDENIRDIILTSSINVTITSTEEIAQKIKEVTKVYFLQKKHTDESIQAQIEKVTQWREIIRNISFVATQ